MGIKHLKSLFEKLFMDKNIQTGINHFNDINKLVHFMKMKIYNERISIENLNIAQKRQIKKKIFSDPIVFGIDANSFANRYKRVFDRVEYGFLRQIMLSLSSKILPIYVFDGRAPDQKKKTITDRRAKKQRNRAKLEKKLIEDCGFDPNIIKKYSVNELIKKMTQIYLNNRLNNNNNNNNDGNNNNNINNNNDGNNNNNNDHNDGNNNNINNNNNNDHNDGNNNDHNDGNNNNINNNNNDYNDGNNNDGNNGNNGNNGGNNGGNNDDNKSNLLCDPTLDSDDYKELVKLAKKSVYVDQHDIAQVKKLLDLIGIPHITADMEADDMITILYKQNKINACLSNDMDMLPKGVGNVIQICDNGRGFVQYHLDTILVNMGLNQQQFVDLCILLGCDYYSTYLPRMRALELYNYYMSINEPGIDNFAEKYAKIDGRIMDHINSYKDSRKFFSIEQTSHSKNINLKIKLNTIDWPKILHFFDDPHEKNPFCRKIKYLIKNTNYFIKSLSLSH